MKKHVISMEEFDCNHKIILASSKSLNCFKKLEVVVNPVKNRTHYVVTEGLVKVVQGPDLNIAINIYNKLD